MNQNQMNPHKDEHFHTMQGLVVATCLSGAVYAVIYMVWQLF